MRLFSLKVNEGCNDCGKIFTHPIESRDKPIIRTRRLKNVIERLFGGNVLFLLEDGASDKLGIGQDRFPTF